MMKLRVWTVGIPAGRAAELEAFVRTVSRPMFAQQAGCLGVFFARSDDECATISLWSSDQAILDMERSDRYRDAVRRITSGGFVEHDHVTQVYGVYDATLDGEGLRRSMMPPSP